MKNIFIILFFVAISSISADAQGCVAIRGSSSCGLHSMMDDMSIKGNFDLQLNYRYFKSFRHFRGSHEETHRIEEGTQVFNYSHFTDIGLSYSISDRWSLNLVLPFVHHRRTSMYEHGGNPPNGLGERHETSSKGLADLRIESRYWLFKPGKKSFNYAVGLGVKLPTGSFDYEDVFYNQGENKDEDIYKVVDQSIQPGDGGLGFSVNLQGFHSIGHKFNWVSNLYYLFNVEETNGVLTRNGSSEFSCPDQFSFQTGLEYYFNDGMKIFTGGRVEGVPSSDLIGGSEGYRRPGYVISVEPGIGYDTPNLSMFLSMPVALYRNRTQSYIDKVRTEQSGTYRHGDAAFADFLVNFIISYRISGSGNHDPVEPDHLNTF